MPAEPAKKPSFLAAFIIVCGCGVAMYLSARIFPDEPWADLIFFASLILQGAVTLWFNFTLHRKEKDPTSPSQDPRVPPVSESTTHFTSHRNKEGNMKEDVPAGPSGPGPRPGIMALQALRWYQIAGVAARFVRANPAAVLAPTLLAALVLIGGGGLTWWWLFDPATAIDNAAAAAAQATDPAAAEAAAQAAAAASSPQDLLFSLVLLALYFILAPPAAAMVLSTLRPAVLGHSRVSLSQAWAATRPHLRSLYGVWAVLTLIGLIPTAIQTAAAAPFWNTPDTPAEASDTIGVLASILTVAAVLLLIYVSVLLAFAPAAVIVEGLTAGAALRRSLDLVHRSWWRCFAVLVAISVILLIVATLITLPALAAAIAIGFAGPLWIAILGVGAVLAAVFAISCSYGIGATALLYQDQRIRREDYATDLIHDARLEP